MLTAEEIQRKIKEIYDVEIDTRTIRRNINLLKYKLDYDISTREDNGKGYYINRDPETDFEPGEVRAIIDNFSYANYIVPSVAKEIIKKCKNMQTVYENEKLNEMNSARVYALTQAHKHLPEMAAISGLKNQPIFSPIVDDYYSGMLVTVPFFGSQVKGGIDAVKPTYIKKYQGKIFVDISDINAENQGAMLGSNNLSGKDNMQIFVCGNNERFTVSARFDNLGKGASGAAVQCMNIMLGFNETEGLDL